MSSYVDQLRVTPTSLKGASWRYSTYCHLFADTEQELHSFAASLKLKKRWFQIHGLVSHYDLTKTKRQQAIRLGAIEILSKEYIQRLRVRRNLISLD